MKRSLCILAATAIGVSCSKKDDADTAAPASTASIATASALVVKVNESLASIPAEDLSLASAMSGNALCTEHGQPLKDGVTTKKGEDSLDADRLSHTDKVYPSRLFMCLATLSAKDGASVETIQGSLAQFSSVLCSFEKTLGTIEYTTAGKDLIAGKKVVMTLDSSCWPNGTPEGISEIQIDSATATLLDESTGYEKELKFSAEAAGVDYKLRFFNRDGVIGFKTMDTGVSPGIGGYTEMVLDSNNGAVLVNTVDDRNGSGGSDSAFRRVARLQVKGVMNSSLIFTSLTGMQGIRAESGNYASDPDTFSGATIYGTKTEGFYGTSVNYSGSVFTTSYAGCTGTTTCPAKGLEFTDNKFYSDRTEWAKHLESGLPPCYKDGVDLNFSGVMTGGKFGKCS